MSNPVYAPDASNPYGPPTDQQRFNTIMKSAGHKAPASQFHEAITPFMPLAERAEILAHYVDDGPRGANELDMDYRIRVERANENMGIEHRQIERPIWAAYPLEQTHDLRLQWHKDMAEKWEEHKYKIAPGPNYDQIYHNAFVANRAARQVRNAAKRAKALERKRQIDVQNGNSFSNTPEPPDDSGDELWDWGWNGPLDVGWNPRTEYENMVGNNSNAAATTSDTAAGPQTQNPRRGHFTASGAADPPASTLGRSRATVASTTLPPAQIRGRKRRQSPDPPAPPPSGADLSSGPKYSNVRCNNCAQGRRACSIKNTGVPCNECVARGKGNTCNFERLKKNAYSFWTRSPTRVYGPNAASRAAAVSGSSVSIGPGPISPGLAAPKTALRLRVGTGLEDPTPAPDPTPPHRGPKRPIKETRKKKGNKTSGTRPPRALRVNKCTKCRRDKKKCYYDENGPPCARCIHLRKQEECVLAAIIGLGHSGTLRRGKRQEKPGGNEEQQDGESDDTEIEAEPCDNCIRNRRVCDRERPCSACVSAGQHNSCDSSSQSQEYTSTTEPRMGGMDDGMGGRRRRERGRTPKASRSGGRGPVTGGVCDRNENQDEDEDDAEENALSDSELGEPPTAFDIPTWAQPNIPQPRPLTPPPRGYFPPPLQLHAGTTFPWSPFDQPADDGSAPLTGIHIDPLRTLQNRTGMGAPGWYPGRPADLQPQRPIRLATEQITLESLLSSSRQRATQEMQTASSGWQDRGQQRDPDEDDEMADANSLNIYGPMSDADENIYDAEAPLNPSYSDPAPPRLLPPAPVLPLPDFALPAEGGREIPQHPVLREISVPANRDWKGAADFYGKPNCHEWKEWFRLRREGKRCHQLPSNNCQVLDHTAWCTCVPCHDDQNNFYRNDENLVIDRTKAYYCVHCAQETKMEKRNHAESAIQLGLCLCSGQMKKTWLCHGHRGQAIELVQRRTMLAEDYVIRSRQGAPIPCAKCVVKEPDRSSGCWTCVACQEVVVDRL